MPGPVVVDFLEGVMPHVTLVVTIKRYGEWRWRWGVARVVLCFGAWMMSLGARVAGMGFKVEELDEVATSEEGK